MKRTYTCLIALITIGAELMILPASTWATDDGAAIAMRQDMPGKNNVDGHGPAYTENLYNRLIKAGCEAYLISYAWRRSFEPPDQTRKWSMVVYLDAADRYWAMDSYSTTPVWVPGKDLQKWVSRMYPKLITRVLSSRTEPRFVGQYADLNRPPVVSTLPANIKQKPVTLHAKPSAAAAN